jgi:hypothetical protein
MGSVEDRLRRLEERRAVAPLGRVWTEEERHSRWLSRQRVRHRETTPKAAHHAREYLGWLRMVGRVPGDA